jgi:hypothetical protein
MNVNFFAILLWLNFMFAGEGVNPELLPGHPGNIEYEALEPALFTAKLEEALDRERVFLQSKWWMGSLLLAIRTMIR